MSARERAPKGGWIAPGPDTWNGETREEYERKYCSARPRKVAPQPQPEPERAAPAEPKHRPARRAQQMDLGL